MFTFETYFLYKQIIAFTKKIENVLIRQFILLLLNMENLGEKLKEAYSLVHKWNNENAKKIFEEIHALFTENQIIEWSDLFWNYISSLLWLWSIYMKEGDLNKSLEYYEKWYRLTKWKDFNILFNLGVAHTNLGNINESNKYLDEAKKIDPNNANLLRFLNEQWKPSELEAKNNIDTSFTSKIQEMIKKIK